jgi:vesicle coat complex subunit
MATVIAPAAGAPPAAPANYFTDQKKGEVNELRALLKTVNVDRDPMRKREVIKKVIAYMTLGIDVSRLFNEMVLCVETKDLVVKKMVYLYLTSYAQEHPDMALMCLNSLHRDCIDQDPTVRGLALRSLCSLRLPSMVEYILDPMRKALGDPNAYVRKTAVMGVLKVFHLSPDAVTGPLLDRLQGMLGDPDGGVVANCLMALSEVALVGEQKAGVAATQPLVHALLGRLNDFNEWGLHQVLEVVARYAPADEQEVFNVMNLLDPLLRTVNSGVVLATVKAFVHLTAAMPAIHRQLYERIKAPVLTLLASGSPETVFCMLKHTALLVHRCPGIFDDDYKQVPGDAVPRPAAFFKSAPIT